MAKGSPEEFPKNLTGRLDISHLNANFTAWNETLTGFDELALYTFDEVKSTTQNTTSRVFQYELDSLTWESEFSVRTFGTKNHTFRKTLVIHLPNYGYFYINGAAISLGKSNGKGYKTRATRIHATPIGRSWTRWFGNNLCLLATL